MKIALCLIVKGTDEEARLLKRCLDSVSPFVDGIFVTRTYSKGEVKNKAIANVVRHFNGVLSDFEWIDDFASARNFNFAQAPSNFDWILWCDADDVWKGLEKLRATIEKNKHVDGFGFWYLYDWDEWKKPVVVHRKTMLVRNDGCATWVGSLHEDLEPNRQMEVHLVEGIDRLHLSFKERQVENAQRNVLIAEKQVKDLPNDPRSSWNLANSQFAVSDFKNAEKSFLSFLAHSESDVEKYLAHTRLADVYKSIQNRDMAIKELQNAIGLDPTLPDAYLQLAFYYFQFGDMDKAEFYCINGLKKRPQILKMVVYNPRDYDYNPLMLLAKIYAQKNRPDLMLPLIKGCLKIYPKDVELKQMVKFGEKDKKMLGKALEKVQILQKIKDKKVLRKELDKLSANIKSHPAIAVIRNTNFIKETSTGNDLVIYCGNTKQEWNPELFKTKMVGGSEEAVVNLAREWSILGWNVTVYNNCGHKEIKGDGVTYKPFWEFNYRDKQDVVILWRWAKPLDADINCSKIFLDLHDVIPEAELTQKRMEKVTKVFVKTQFHRSLFPNVPDNKFAIVPNGMDIYFDESIKKEPMLLINTSSPDRSMDVLPKLFKEIKKRVPSARLQWAYGWEGFIDAYATDAKKMAWMEKTKLEMLDVGIESLSRLSQMKVGELYQRASCLLYPTEFSEIDCISVKKAQMAGCFPITTDFGALAESNKFGTAVHSTKTKDNWNKPYQFHFGLEDKATQDTWVEMVVRYLTGSPLIKARTQGKDVWLSQFNWKVVAKKWDNEFSCE
jgi:tetratricopeptide (TPR) repeat protein